MFRKSSKDEMLGLLIIFSWIFIVNIATLALLPDLQAWPMFLVTIFFYTMGGETKNIPSIFCGGLFGLLMALGLTMGLGVLLPSLGLLGALAILLFLILFLVIVGGAFAPVICNNMAFAYLTVATINIESVPTQMIRWIGMLLVGGGVILGGCLVLTRVYAAIMARKDIGAPAVSAATEE